MPARSISRRHEHEGAHAPFRVVVDPSIKVYCIDNMAHKSCAEFRLITEQMHSAPCHSGKLA